MEQGLISIIIVTLGEDEALDDCLASLKAHVHCVHEVIVVNNGAEPLSLEQSDHLRVIENGRNLGFARAVNRGIEASAGEYVLLLNSDTEFTEDVLLPVRVFMEAHPKAGVAGVQLTFADGRLQNSVDIIPSLFTEFVNKSLLKILFPRLYPSKRSGFTKPVQVPSVIGAFMLIRRELIDAIGMLDEGYFFYLEETDFCLRAAQHGFEVWHLPNIKLIHHQGLTARKIDTRRKVEFARSLHRFFRKNRGPIDARLFTCLSIVKLWVEFIGELPLLWRERSRSKARRTLTILAWHLLGHPEGWGIERHPRRYRTVRRRGYKWFVPEGRELPAAAYEIKLFMQHLDGPVLNDSRTTHVRRGTLLGETVYLKRYNFKGLRDTAKNLFRKSRALRSLEAAQTLEDSGLRTPAVLFACERRFCGILLDSYILTRGITARDLVQKCAEDGCNDDDVIRVARFLRRVHELGILHVDLKGENLMIDEDGAISLIDLDRMQHVSRLDIPARAKNLSYLNASFARTIPLATRQMFLNEYVKGDPNLEGSREILEDLIRVLTQRRLATRY